LTIYLADTSAWHHSVHPEIATTWIQRLGDDEVATCSQVRLEILYSARSADDYERLVEELTALHHLPCGDEHLERALEVQRELARQGGLHHRSVKIADLLVAASAETGGAVVWHYDEDFDRIAAITSQPVEWVAPRGTLQPAW